MKKAITFITVVAMAAAGFSATLYTEKDPKPGIINANLKTCGRIESVDVFSALAEGTVEIGRIFELPIFTNAYDITSAVVTNVEPIVEESFVRENGWVYSLYSSDSQTVVFKSSDDTGSDYRDDATFSYNYSQSAWVYNYASGKGVLSKNGSRNDAVIEWDFGYLDDAPKFTRHQDVTGFTTNVVTVVTTNAVTPVYSHTLTVTNQLLNGSCEGNCYHGKPSPDVWLFPGDKIIFNGTATGGAIRIVIE